MIKDPMLADAILRIAPGAQFSINDDSSDQIEWHDESIPMPTEKQMKDSISAIRAEKEAGAYKEKRAKNYPSVGDQLDALWMELNHNQMTGQPIQTQAARDMLGQILQVKETFPKGE